jgi:serine O-acetyltransferase
MALRSVRPHPPTAPPINGHLPADLAGGSALTEDLRHMTASWGMSPSQVWGRVLVRLPLYPRLKVGILFRASSWCWHRRLGPLALWLQAHAVRVGGAEIHPAAEIGPGFATIHTAGIVVGHEVVAGRNLVLYHGVTLGHTGTGPGQPYIGDDVRIGAGAKVLGPIRVGNRAWIGANAVVLADVPDDGVVGGVWRGSATVPTS